MMIRFIVSNLYTKFQLLVPVADMPGYIAQIREQCQARPEGYRYMPAFKAGHWDGYVKLISGDRFPTGLLRGVLQALDGCGESIDVAYPDIPDVNISGIVPNMFDDIVLRDYQVDAAKTLLANSRGIASMATNSGKTEVIAAIARVVPGGVLVLTTSKDLLYQTAERLSSRLGEMVGVIGDGSKDSWQRVTVAMVQTLVRLPGLEIDAVDCICYDECHHLSSRTSQEVVYRIDAPFRFGFSGTPIKDSKLLDLMLIGATGPVLVDISNMELIDVGISAKPTVCMYEIDNLVCDETCTWQEAYMECIVGNMYRNQVIADLVVCETGCTLILVERIGHGEALRKMIPGSIFVNGSNTSTQRVEVLDSMRTDVDIVVIATSIFDEGVDVPAIDTIVMAGGGRARGRLLQRLGRGMRKKGGSNELRVIDFVDYTNGYLTKHSVQRCETYEHEGFTVEVVCIPYEGHS